MKKITVFVFLVMFALSPSILFAATTKTSAKIRVRPTSATMIKVFTCVDAAVTTRETALGTAIAAQSSAVALAYTNRAAALKLAYTGSFSGEIENDVKSSWSSFNKSVREANSAWRKARNAAWDTYKISLKSCATPKDITDASNFSMEVTGE